MVVLSYVGMYNWYATIKYLRNCKLLMLINIVEFDEKSIL